MRELNKREADTSDIPETGEEFFKKAKLVKPKKKAKKK